MTWAAPWALIALVGLPLAWWWHRRRRRPRTVDLSSLLFLQPELDAQPAHRRVVDPELLLALLAIVLLALAAARPAVVLADAGRTLRVVVSKGAPAAARGYEDRVSRALDELRDGLGSSDRLVVIEEPTGGGDLLPRPSQGALRATAQGGDAAGRVVISDQAAATETAGVTWIAVGSPEAFNVGLVAASLSPGDGRLQVFVNVQGDSARAANLRVVLMGDNEVLAEAPMAVPAGGFASKAFVLEQNPLGIVAELRASDGSAWVDDLAPDDRVTWAREVVRVHLDDGLPDALHRAVEDVLLARFGRGGYLTADRDVALAVTTGVEDGSGAPWTLVLHAAEAGTAEAPPGADHALDDPLVADLGTGGVGLVYASGVLDEENGRALLWRRTGGRLWPVVTRRDRVMHFLPDPTRGRPPPAAMPLWPLFVDNLLAEVAGRSGAGGTLAGRRQGLLDPESSRLGRVAGRVQTPALSAAPADRPERRFALWPWLLGGALVLLGLLWAVPWSGRGRRRKRRSSSVGPPVPSSS